MTTKVCFVAAPLTARSGVYRSAREIVEEGRAQGLDWSLFLGVSERANGKRPAQDPPWVIETKFEPNGLRGVRDLRTTLLREPVYTESDLVISLIPQADMAMGLTARSWIAYLRGLPWPEAGEASRSRRLFWELLERLSLRRADETWVTTEVLGNQLGRSIRPHIVPAGIRPVDRTWDGTGRRDLAVWAARFDHDKRPELFLEALRGQSMRGVMFGSGPLKDRMSAVCPPNVAVGGWVAPHELWNGALAYVGTSTREAFGRSAVEAAMSGIPVVISDAFGCADFLYSDADLKSRFVIAGSDLDGWRSALQDLHRDEGLRTAVSDHLFDNAKMLTMEYSVSQIRSRIENVVNH
jgi:glycosyltransferase involved in cell wall biosynthesis